MALKINNKNIATEEYVDQAVASAVGGGNTSAGGSLYIHHYKLGDCQQLKQNHEL